MIPTSSVARTATVHPSAAQVQAHRALRRAEGDGDLLATLSLSARELTTLVADACADAESLRRRLRSFDAFSSAPARQVEGARLARALDVCERHVGALEHELVTLEGALSQLQTTGAQRAQHHALGQQIEADGRDVEGLRGDLTALREAMAQRDGLAVQRQEALASARRGQDAMADAVAPSEAAPGTQGVAQALLAPQGPAATPPAWMLPDLQGFVEEWNGIVRDPRGLSEPDRPGAPTDGRVAGLQTRWSAWNLRTQAPKHIDPNELTQWVMQQAYRDNTQDLRSYAMRLEFHTSVKARLRDELNRARLWRSEHAPKAGEEGKLTEPYRKQVVPLEPLIDADGNWHLRDNVPGEEVENPDTLQEYIREIEQNLQVVGDDMQISQIELQMMSQRQQQLLSSLSSLSKAQHETSMAILRKIGT